MYTWPARGFSHNFQTREHLSYDRYVHNWDCLKTKIRAAPGRKLSMFGPWTAEISPPPKKKQKHSKQLRRFAPQLFEVVGGIPAVPGPKMNDFRPDPGRLLIFKQTHL